jgi:hypothetical protein
MSSATWPVRLGFQLKALQCDGASHAMPGTGIAFLGGRYLGRSVLVAGGANFEGSVAHRTASCLRCVHVTPPGLGEVVES